MARKELQRRAEKGWSEHRVSHPRARDLVDPLSDVTRRERTFLLTLSAILYAIAIGDLVPTKIQALGIELAPSRRVNILWMLAAIELFLLVAFLVYSGVDIEAWEADFRAYQREKAKAVMAEMIEPRPDDTSSSDTAREMLIHEYPATDNYQARRNFDQWAPVLAAILALLLISARGCHLLP